LHTVISSIEISEIIITTARAAAGLEQTQFLKSLQYTGLIRRLASEKGVTLESPSH